MNLSTHCLTQYSVSVAALLLSLPAANLSAADPDGTQANPYSLTTAINPLNTGYWYTLGSNVTYTANNALIGYDNTTATTGIIISSGYTMTCTGTLNMSYYANVSSSIIVDGGTLSLSSSSDYRIGNYGTASLLIQNGGTATGYNAYVGSEANSSGSLTVTGTGSSMTLISSLSVGNSGTGTLNVESGGALTIAGFSVGNAKDGTATITGANSKLTNNGSLSIGAANNGSLTISNRAVLENKGTIRMGSNQNAYTKTLTVTGAGSKLTSTGITYIGYNSTSSMNINGGGVVSTTGTSNYVGYALSGNNSMVTVTGEGSAWLNTGFINLGRSNATGKLTIDDGALVTASELTVESGSSLYIKGGFLALSGASATSDYNALLTLLTGGTTVYAWDSTTDGYVLINEDNYETYTVLKYYLNVEDCDALDSYGLSGSYTVLTSTYFIVPEPSTYALFGGLGALGFVLLRRRSKTQKNSRAEA